MARFTIGDDSLEGIIITRDEWYFVEPLQHLDSGSDLTVLTLLFTELPMSRLGALRECGTALPSRLENGLDQ